MVQEQIHHEKRKYKLEPASRKKNYKGLAPFKTDILLFGILFAFFGVIFLYLIYFLLVDVIRSYEYYNLLYEIVCVMGIMIFADFIAYIVSNLLDDLIIHQWGYVRNPRTKKNKMFRLVDYSIYTIIRALFLVFAIVWILSAYLYEQLPMPWHRASFFIAWLLLSMSARFSAWIITNTLFPS